MADEPDAVLELTFLSAEGLKDVTTKFLGKAKPFIVAWIDDPRLEKPTKIDLSRQQRRLHLPLSPRSLRNPSSSYLTVQILSSGIGFRSKTLIAAAALPLSSLRLAGETLTLPLRRPSGRPHGSLLVSVRILWCLTLTDRIPGAPTETALSDGICPTAPPIPDLNCAFMEDEESLGSQRIDLVHPNAPPLPPIPDLNCAFMKDEESFGSPRIDRVHPNAPPLLMPDGNCAIDGFLEEEEGLGLLMIGPVHPNAPPLSPMPDGDIDVSGDLDVSGYPEDVGNPNPKYVVPGGSMAWRSFLIGLASGTVASVLVSAAGLSGH